MKLTPYLAALSFALSPAAFAQTPAVPTAAAQPQGIAVLDNQSIGFLGDSITRDGAELPGGYVCLVVTGLKANGIRVTPYPAGVGGNRSDQMLERLDSWVLSHKPDWMTLSCGVNDVWQAEKGIPLDKYKVNITTIVDKAQAAGVKVMLLTATIIGEQPNNPNNVKLAGYNDFLKQLAKEKGCLLADTRAAVEAALDPKIKGRNQLTVDGVHMNPAGNQVMAVAVLRGFGLDDAQIQKAREAWLAMPEIAGKVSAKGGVTLRQYEQLREMAAKQNRSIEEIAGEQLTKALQTFVPEPGASK